MITSDTPSFQNFNILGVKHITPENAYSALKSRIAILVDIREEDEHMIEYISLNDVYHFPMSSIMDNLKNIPGEKSVFVVSQGGVQSVKVTNMLNRNGFANSVNLDGGLIAWKNKGLPYETILPDACSGCKGSCSCSQ